MDAQWPVGNRRNMLAEGFSFSCPVPIGNHDYDRNPL